MNIVITFSPNWGRYIVIELFALFKCNPSPVKVYLISDGLSDDILKEFDNVCRLCGSDYTYEYINASDTYNKYITSNINVTSRFSKYTLYRLLLTKLIDEDRVLYIDADAICNGSLVDFYNMDMGNNCVVGVVDTGINVLYKIKYGLSYSDIYCNAGVLLLDLAKIKKLGIDEEWIKLVNVRRFENNDQDIIMTTCKGMVGSIGVEYNTSLSTGLDIKPHEIKICHYAGIKDKNLWVKKLPFSMIWDKWEEKYNVAKQNKKEVIPRKIFYAWFGFKSKPKLVQKCIDSWKLYCSDYEIIELNESNLDLTCNEFVKQAYKNKKYAFVNDYCRMKYLYEYGGIYLDADVEILKPLDRFLQYEYVSGHETDSIPVCATMMSRKEHPYVKMLLDYYDNAEVNFDKPNTNFIKRLTYPWIINRNNGFAYLKDGGIVFPVNTFAPFNHTIFRPLPTEETYTVHHFMGSWKPHPNYILDYKDKLNTNVQQVKVINTSRDIRMIDGKKVRPGEEVLINIDTFYELDDTTNLFKHGIFRII